MRPEQALVERLREAAQLLPITAASLDARNLLPIAADLIERLEVEKTEAEASLWRVFPNTHTVFVDEYHLSKNPDPFEGKGETYKQAYERLSKEVRLWENMATKSGGQLQQVKDAIQTLHGIALTGEASYD